MKFPHWLSLSGKMILFRLSGKNEIAFGSVAFTRGDNVFVTAAEGAAVLAGAGSTGVDIVKCQCVVNIHKRVTTACVLVAKKSKRGESFRYSLLTLSSSLCLVPCIDFKLPYRIQGCVFILHGPTVLWSHAGHIYYTSLQAEEVRQIPIQLSHCVFGELPIHKEQVFVLGLQTPPELHPTSQTLGYFVETGQVFDGSLILPHPYVSVTRCILVLSADKVDGDEHLKSAVVAATSNRQLVYFENGTVKDVCQLPYDEPESVQVVDTGRDGLLFVISFQQGHVCTVWRETFQVASQWSDVSSVHVDDFVGCGSDQMLLVFTDQGTSEKPLERFLLTDLCGISYAGCQDSGAPKPASPPPENYLLTLKALESRLQSGLSVVQELQREVGVKERVLRQSVQALTDVISGREHHLTTPEQEGLVALWDCDDDESKEGEARDDETQDMPAVSSKPQVDRLWHRIAGDRMVVGVILTPGSSAPMASLSLSVLTETGQSSTPAVIQTQSQVCWLPAPCSSSSSSSSSSASTFPEPAAKRSKPHNDLNTCRLAVTAATRLTPLLNSGCVKCRVMLHYVPGQDAFAPVSNQTPAFLHCGQVPLDIRIDFQTPLLKNPQLNTDEAAEDWLSLMALLDRWLLHIDSPHHSLGDLRGWIQERVGCKRIEVCPEYLLLNSPGPSAPMLLHWQQITPFQGELSVHSSEFQMLQFLDSLLAYLPVTCSIRTIKGSTGPRGAQMFSLALEEELVSLRECASSLLCGETKRSLGPGESPDPATAQGLERCREVWQRDVERSRARLSTQVEAGLYREVTQRMLGVQLSGDLAALLHTQRTLLS